MPVNKKVIERERILDSLLRTPNGISYEQLQKKLYKRHIDVSIRTIKEDIHRMMKYGSAKLKFFRKKGGHSVFVRYENIAVSPVTEDIKNKLRKKWDNPHFLLAASIVEHLGDSISVEQFNQAVDFNVNTELTGIEFFNELLNSIINRNCVTIDYKPFSKNPVSVTVSPYVLKEYNNRWFLICRTLGRSNYFTNALDRIRNVRPTPSATYEEPDYEYIRDCFNSVVGITDAFRRDKKIEKIRLKVTKALFNYIETKPIHPDQEVRPLKDGKHYHIDLNLKVNYELIHLLIGLGSGLKVIYPKSLQKSVADEISKISDLYNITRK